MNTVSTIGTGRADGPGTRPLPGDRMSNRLLAAIAGPGHNARRKARAAGNVALALAIAALSAFLVLLLMSPPRDAVPSAGGTRGTEVPPSVQPGQVPDTMPGELPLRKDVPSVPVEPAPAPPAAPTLANPEPTPSVEPSVPMEPSPSEIIMESVPPPPRIPAPRFQTRDLPPKPRPVRPRASSPESGPRFEIPESLRPSS